MKAVDLYKTDRKNEMISYGITVLIHLLMLLLLYWAVLLPPNPPWEEEMGGGGSPLSMSLGTQDAGGPDLIPVEEAVTPPTPQPETPEQLEQILTQDANDAPEIETPKEEKKPDVKKTPDKKPDVKTPVEKKPEKPVEAPRKVDAHSLFKKKSNTTNADGSGTGEAPGNEGRPDGDPNGKPGGDGSGDGTGGSGSGTGKGHGVGTGTGTGAGDGPGTGFGFDLNGRSVARKPVITDNSRETGKVVVQIVVDRSGKVIKATPGYKGSTTLNSALLEKARQGALETRFSPKADGPEEQFGTMTIIFRFKQ